MKEVKGNNMKILINFIINNKVEQTNFIYLSTAKFHNIYKNKKIYTENYQI